MSGAAKTERPLRAILPWFGGKRSMAPMIVRLLTGGRNPDRFTSYTEPFHGSCAVLMALRAAGYTGPATVNDLHRLASTTARVIAQYPKAVQHSLTGVLFHEADFMDAQGRLRRFQSEPDLLNAADVARDYLIVSWMGMNDRAGLKKELDGSFAVRWEHSGGDSAVRWQKVVESVPEWSRLLGKATTFLCRDGLDVLDETKDVEGALIYADPTYIKDSRESGEYAVEPDDGTGTFYENKDFHARLAAVLNSKQHTRIVVSYYAHERLATLYPASKWTVIDATRNKNAGASTRGDGREESPERLLCNFTTTEGGGA